MSYLRELRRRMNRDDGKLLQVGNRPIGCIEGVGLLLFVGGICLWQLNAKTGLSEIWTAVAGALGFLLCILGNAWRGKDSGV